MRPAWFVADEGSGMDGSFWWWLEQSAQQSYILTVSKKQSVVLGWQQYRAEDLVQSLQPEQWQRLSCGNGSKGERYYDWARIAVNCDRSQGRQRWLLFRRALKRTDESCCISYYQVFAPAETSLEIMAHIAGQRWRLEECFKLANQLGLGDYEVRSWPGWHRHPTLVLAAQVFLTVLLNQVEPDP